VSISNGGSLRSGGCSIGSSGSASNNEALVTGPGTVWTNSGDIFVGGVGKGNRLVVSNGAMVVDFGDFIVGSDVASSGNRLVVDGGTLVTTGFTNRGLDVRRGTAVFNTGLIDVGRLLLTNTQGFLQFNGGTLSVLNSRVSNGTFFQIGNGISPATLNLAGNGLHDFSGMLGVSVSSNAVLAGNGTFKGSLSVLSGGKLIPGISVGKIILSNSPSLQGAILMEISKNGATLTNDQIQVAVALTYGGTLAVTNLGPTALVAGNGFQLFSATSYSGSFSAISVPPLGPGLTWTNKLNVDGSIQVIGTAQPVFASTTLSGTNLVITGTNGTPGTNYTVLTTTNLTIPLSNWVSILTNQFSPTGAFSFTNAIAPGEPQRYFRIRTP